MKTAKWFEQSMAKAFDQVFTQMHDARESLQPFITLQQIGSVQSVSNGIAIVVGLAGVEFKELLSFPNGIKGLAFPQDNEEISVVLLGENAQIRVGDQVSRLRHIIDIKAE